MKVNIVIFVFFILIAFAGCLSREKPKQSDELGYNEQIFPLIDNNDVNAIHKLINNGYELNINIEYGDGFNRREYTPLSYAVEKNKPDVVNILLENNVDIELCTTWGSPLVIAARENNFYLVKLLLDNGADVNNDFRFANKFAEGESAIFMAVLNLNFEMYDYLIEKGADVNIGMAIEHENALMALIQRFRRNNDSISRYQFIKMVDKLIDDGIDINRSVHYGNIFTEVVGSNDIELMKILLNNGADLNIYLEERGMSTYEYISTHGSIETIDLINKQ